MFISIASLSKLTAATLTLLIESRPLEGLRVAEATLLALLDTCKNVESDWESSPLANVSNKDVISQDSRAMTTSIWTILKTLLFSTVMVADSILAALVYVPPHIYQSGATATPASLSRIVLRMLSHLSFVISQFGGFTSNNSGFKELKKVFYLAVDILVQSADEAGEILANELCVESSKMKIWLPRTVLIECIARYHESQNLFTQSKKAYIISCVEQLIPVLSADCIEQNVFPLCVP